MFDKTFSHYAIIAPSSPAPEKTRLDCLAQLRADGESAAWMPHVSDGSVLAHLSASPEARAADLMQAWSDPATAAILCMRGGTGAAQLLPLLDWDLLRSRRMPLLGYSDVSALHLAMLKMDAGIPVVAPMLTLYPKAKNDPYLRQSWRNAFSGSDIQHILPPPGQKLEFLRPCTATALPIATNITVAASLCGTPYLPDTAGKIVILEDIGEEPRRLDRSLTQLHQCGFFEDCAAIVFGQFTDCGDAAQLQELYLRALDWTDGAVVTGFPYGHELPFAVIRLDRQLHLAPQ